MELNWESSQEDIHAAATGADKAIRMVALSMAGTSRMDLMKAFNDPDPEIVAAAVANPRAAGLLRKAMDHASPIVRAAAAGNQSLGSLPTKPIDEICQIAANDRSASVQLALAQNIATPEVYLSEMANGSSHDDVRAAATQTLAGSLRSQGTKLNAAEELALRGEMAMFGTNIHGLIVRDASNDEQGLLVANAALLDINDDVIDAEYIVYDDLRLLADECKVGGVRDLPALFSAAVTDMEIDRAFAGATVEATVPVPFVATAPTAAGEGARSPLLTAALVFAAAPLVGVDEAAQAAGAAHSQVAAEAERLDADRRRATQMLLQELMMMAGRGDKSVLLYPEVTMAADASGKSPLHRLAEKGVFEALTHPQAATVRDLLGRTPLHYGAEGLRAAVTHKSATIVADIEGVTPAQIYQKIHGQGVAPATPGRSRRQNQEELER